MTSGTQLTRGNARSALSDRGNDLYETPPVAVEALLRVEPLPQHIWEPACGPGAIVKVLRRSGKKVTASDLVDYGSLEQDHQWDFLFERTAPDGVQAIVTNPPFKNAEAFVSHALDLCPKVVMLLRLAFLESEKRRAILESGHLACVYVFRKRLPMMHRHGWEGSKVNSGMAFAWYVWDRNYYGPTLLHRISWEEKETRNDRDSIEHGKGARRALADEAGGLQAIP